MRTLARSLCWVLLASACAGTAPAAGNGSDPPATIHAGLGSVVSVAGLPDARLVVLTGPLRYRQAGYLLAPPPASATPRTGPAAAYGSCRVDAVCAVGDHPSILLAVASQDGVTGGGQLHPDGSVTPFLDHTLSWVLTYTGQPCPVSAGAMRSTATTSSTQPPRTDCTIVNIISADSGRVIVSAEGSDL